MILKEFLVALGLKDDMSEKLKSSMDNADSTVSHFTNGFAKKFALAGTAVVTFAATAATGLAKFATSLVKSDDELTAFQRKFGLSRDEAYKTKSALDVMGKSLEEVQLDPKLLAQFNELKENAADLKVPDNTEGLKTVRAITTSVLALKQTATNALQWVGHSFLKYVQKPMEDVQNLLKGFNDKLKKNIPDWADKIGKALSWVVQLGGTIIRAGAQMLGALKKVFDAIPSGVKVAMAALGGLAAFIKMGPIGKLITIISLALLLLDDFFTFLDGGDSLLGPVWKTLTDFFGGFEESGKTALSFFTEDFLPKLVDYISGIFPKLVEKVLSYVDPFVEWAVEVLSGIIDAIAAAIPELIKLAGNIALAILDGLLSKLPTLLDGVTEVIRSLIEAVREMIPALLAVIGDIVSRLIDIITESLPDILDAAIELVMAVVDGITDALPDILAAIVELLDKLLTAIINALPKIVESGVKIVEKLVEGILQALPKILDAVLTLIKQLVAQLTKQLPQLIKAGIQIIQSLINGIVQMLPEIIEAAIELVTQLLEAIADMLPEIIDMGIEILLSLIDGILNMLPKLIEAAIILVTKILTAIVENLPKIIQAGIKILVSLIQGIVDAIPKLVEQIVALIPVIVQAIVDNLPKIIEAGINILLSLINGIVESIPQLVQAVVDLIPVIVQTVIDNLPKIIEAGIQVVISLIGGLIQAIPKLIEAIPQIVGAIINGLGSALSGALDIGKSIVEGLWDGICGMGNWITEKVGGFFSNIFGGIGDFFGGLFGGNDTSGESPEGHAEGGVFTKEHYAEFAEDDKPEAVIPLTKPKRAADVLKQAADYMTGDIPAMSNGSNQTRASATTPSSESNTEQATVEADKKPNAGKSVSKLESILQTILSVLQKISAVLLKAPKDKQDRGEQKPNIVEKIKSTAENLPVVGNLLKAGSANEESKTDYSEIANRILTFLDNAEQVMAQMVQVSQSTVAYNSVSNSSVSYNTTNIDNKQNYTINDTSGNPRTTADMVGRTQELHSRNLKGVFA